MYRPNFCVECGVRIERARWHVWTSRRFCAKCAARFRRARLTWSLMAWGALLCAGFIAGRAARPAPPPLLVEHDQTPASVNQSPIKALSSNMGPTPIRTPAAQTYSLDSKSIESPTDPNEIVSICGARTKKGTPCQRRVRGTGRCWQHRGMPAMLPASKLILSN